MSTDFLTALVPTLGFILAGLTASGVSSHDCCSLNLACCNGSNACCSSADRPDCCEQGLACCVENAPCCSVSKDCCAQKLACCEVEAPCCSQAAKSSTVASQPKQSCCSVSRQATAAL